jgi:hypothetical protein
MRLIFQKEKPRAEQEGFLYLGSSADTANKLTNGTILIISTVLKHVMSSAAEAEIGAVLSMPKKAQSFAQYWRN